MMFDGQERNYDYDGLPGQAPARYNDIVGLLGWQERDKDQGFCKIVTPMVDCLLIPQIHKWVEINNN